MHLIVHVIDSRKIPDVAFMIGPIQGSVSWSRSDDRVDIMFFLREDKESTVIKYRYNTGLGYDFNTDDCV